MTTTSAVALVTDVNERMSEPSQMRTAWHNGGMTAKRGKRTDLTPAGRLEEVRLQRVLGYQLAQAALVTDAIFRDQVGGPLELGPVEYTVLTLIAENPGGSLARLARALSVTPPHITALVDRLEARGLVARNASDADRRAQVLSVTRAVRRSSVGQPASSSPRRTSCCRSPRASRRSWPSCCTRWPARVRTGPPQTSRNATLPSKATRRNRAGPEARSTSARNRRPAPPEPGFARRPGAGHRMTQIMEILATRPSVRVRRGPLPPSHAHAHAHAHAHLQTHEKDDVSVSTSSMH